MKNTRNCGTLVALSGRTVNYPKEINSYKNTYMTLVFIKTHNLLKLTDIIIEIAFLLTATRF